jgi:hypothetical protein
VKRFAILFCALLVLLGSSGPGRAHVPDYPVMHPDKETMDAWQAQYENAPKFEPDTSLAERTQGPPPVLLDHLTYTPSERNQGTCGNCWVWAGTALLEIAHSVQNGVKDRLSVQKFDSCTYSLGGGDTCYGGNLAGFATQYNQNFNPVPWSNTNAQFQDAAWNGAGPAVTCANVSSAPHYYTNYQVPNSMQALTITTYSAGQATAIANIKNALLQKKGVGFGFWLANNTDWNAFRNFWSSGAATDLWSPDAYCGHTWNPNPGEGGGHFVTIVGWNDDDAANPYWIVLNSWGTTVNRPTGLFRLGMNINYDCLLPLSGGGSYYGVTFQTLNADFTDATYTTGTDTSSHWMAVKGGATGKVFVRSRPSDAAANAGWSSWVDIGGSTSHAPALATFNSRLYMVVKGVASNKIWVRSMGSDKVWTAWATIAGATSDSPTLAVYRNRLYLFVKGNATGALWYTSMDTAGGWAGWQQVPGWVVLAAPAVAVMNDELVLYGVGLDHNIYLRTLSSAGTWGGTSVFGAPMQIKTDRGLAAAVYNDSIVLAAKGSSVDTITDVVSIATSVMGTAGSYYGWSPVPGAATASRPQISSGPRPNLLYVSALSGANAIWYNAYDSTAGAWFSPSGLLAAGTSTDTAATQMYYWR